MASFLKSSPSNFHRSFIPISFSSSSIVPNNVAPRSFLRADDRPRRRENREPGIRRRWFVKEASLVPEEDSGGISEEEDGSKEKRNRGEWIDWEDRILQDTVPLVGFVRMILHSGK